MDKVFELEEKEWFCGVGRERGVRGRVNKALVMVEGGWWRLNGAGIGMETQCVRTKLQRHELQ